MTKLTPTQRQGLEAAAASDDGFMPRDHALTAGALQRLIKAGLLMSIPSDQGDSRLLITSKGLEAIGAYPQSEPTVPQLETAHLERAPSAAAAIPKGKIGIVVSLLGREGGATLAELMAATGWQAHSVRGAISGAVKKGLGLQVSSQKHGDLRTYNLDR